MEFEHVKKRNEKKKMSNLCVEEEKQKFREIKAAIFDTGEENPK